MPCVRSSGFYNPTSQFEKRYINKEHPDRKADMGPVKRNTNIMAQPTYSSVVLAQRPKANIVPGETFKLKQNPMISVSDLKDGQVLVETLYLSLDPAMRGWLNGTFFKFLQHHSRDPY